ncbi:MAG TPA: GNAT family N-acetyltransferase [Acetobacteraceae bacterium]|nr:GNAT family N-acetyltransferase [Acetobacteraceae bacterium]
MNPGVAIRAARWEEAEAVAALFNAINSLDGNTPEVPMTAEAVWRDLLGSDPLATLLVGTLDGAVVGFVTGNRLHDSGRSAGCTMVTDLYVAPAARRHGIGRALMAALAALARARGDRCLWWGVDDGDDEAEEFYRAIGSRREEHFTGMILVGERFEALAAEAGA